MQDDGMGSFDSVNESAGDSSASFVDVCRMPRLGGDYVAYVREYRCGDGSGGKGQRGCNRGTVRDTRRNSLHTQKQRSRDLLTELLLSQPNRLRELSPYGGDSRNFLP